MEIASDVKSILDIPNLYRSLHNGNIRIERFRLLFIFTERLDQSLDMHQDCKLEAKIESYLWRESHWTSH
jgi:hypothetical protein